jgi:CelD/BcsL family acetyltransferase involved in cellulose biosynthesis
MMRLRTHGEIAPLVGPWRELVDRLGASPFVRPEHAQLHRRAFGGGRLRVVTAERDGDLVGLLPLHAVRGSWRSLTNWHTPHNELLIADDDAVQAVLWLLARRGPVRTELRFLLDDDLARLESAADRLGRIGVHHRVVERSPCIPMDGRDHATYHAGLRKRFRAELRRRRRRLEEQGEVRFAVHDGTQGLDGLLRRGFAVEASGWKGQAGSAMASEPDTLAYYRGLARWTAANGWLELAFLEVGGRDVAFALGISADGGYQLIKSGYDPAWRAYSPGQLLRGELIRRAFDRRLDLFDFGGDATPAKLEWTDLVRRTSVVELRPDTVGGRTSLLLEQRLRPMAKRLEAAVRTKVGSS